MKPRLPLIAGLIITIFAACIPWFWIGPNSVIAGIDIPPMVDYHVLYLTTLHTWDSAPNGGISNFVGYGMYWPLFVAGMMLQAVGATPHIINIGAMSLTFAVGALGMYLLARKAGYLAAAALGLAYTLNFAHVFLLPAIGTVIAYAALPWMPLIVIWSSERDRRQQIVIGVVAGLLSTAMICSKINPPTYLTAFVGGVVLSIIGLIAARRRMPVSFIVAFAVSFVVFNAWWIYDFLASLRLDPSAVTAQSHVGAVSADSPLSQVLLLSGSWAFDPAYDKAPYFSYAQWLRRPVTQMLLAMLPLGSIGLLLLFSRVRGAIAALVSTAILSILCEGYHPPFDPLFRFFLRHVPGGWLYREPLTKFDGILLAVYLMGFVAVLPQLRLKRDRIVGYACLALCCIGAVVGGWPILNGSVIRHSGDGRPGFAVQVPQYWYQFAAWANTQRDGRIVMLPEYGEYQVMYDWGYLGADIDGMLLRHPFIDATPSVGYTDSAVQSAALLWYDNLFRKFSYDVKLSRSLANALAIKYAVVRKDVVPSIQSPRLASEKRYLPRLAALGFRQVRSFGQLDVYERRCCVNVGSAHLEGASLFTENRDIRFDANPDVISPDTVLSKSIAAGKSAMFVYPSRQFVFSLSAWRVFGGFELYPVDGFRRLESDAAPVPVKGMDIAFISVGSDLEEITAGRIFDWVSSPGLKVARGAIITAAKARSRRVVALSYCTLPPIKTDGGAVVVVRPEIFGHTRVTFSESGHVVDAIDTMSGVHPLAVFRLSSPKPLGITVINVSAVQQPVRFVASEYAIRAINGWQIRPQGRLLNQSPSQPQPTRVPLDAARSGEFRMRYPAMLQVGVGTSSGTVSIWRILKVGRLQEWTGPMGGQIALGAGEYGISLANPGPNTDSIPLYSHPFSVARVTLMPGGGRISVSTTRATETSSSGTYRATGTGLLVLRQAYSNGWQLKVDAHLIKHLHTAIMENAWIVPAGFHRFHLNFVLERQSNALLDLAKVAALLVLALVGVLVIRQGVRAIGVLR